MAVKIDPACVIPAQKASAFASGRVTHGAITKRTRERDGSRSIAERRATHRRGRANTHARSRGQRYVARARVSGLRRTRPPENARDRGLPRRGETRSRDARLRRRVATRSVARGGVVARKAASRVAHASRSGIVGPRRSRRAPWRALGRVSVASHLEESRWLKIARLEQRLQAGFFEFFFVRARL